MTGHNKSSLTADDLTAAQRDCAHYVADITLQLGNTARQVELSFLAHLLEMAYYEAFRLANGSEPEFVSRERRRQAKETS
jgi:hypothetical protein